ncbi:MAG: hypothetical protein AAGF46_05715 [Pseudomonadota bacterium]
MRQRTVRIISKALACGGLFLWGTARSISVDAEVNLYYALDCLAALIPCTTDAIPLAVDASDGRLNTAVDHWQRLRLRPLGSTPQGALAFEPLPMANLFAAVPGGGSRLQDSDSLQFVTDTLRGDFDRRWRTQSRGHLRRMSILLQAQLTSEPLASALLATAGFLGTDSNDLPTVEMVAITTGLGGSHAHLRGDTMYVETAYGEDPLDRIGVLVHETVHYWMARMSAIHAAAIATEFHRADTHCGGVAFNLFDEAIPTAIGNGYVERLMHTPDRFREYLSLPESFYGDTDIDMLAKAILPLVTEYLDSGRVLDASFVQRYLDIATRVLDERCNSLALQLRTSAFWLEDIRLLEARNVTTRAFGSATVMTDIGVRGDDAALIEFEGLSGIVVATHRQVFDLPPIAPGLKTALHRLGRRYEAFVLAWPRNAQATIYFVVANNTVRAGELLVQLAGLKKDRFTGLWIPPALPTLDSVPE